MDHEVIVVGAGPAGLSAAITLAYYNADVLVIDSASAGGALINQYPWKNVDNYLGIEKKTGQEVSEIMSSHAKREGAKIKENETVLDVQRKGDEIEVTTSKGKYTAKAVILALGLGVPRKLGVDGETMDGVCFSLPDPSKYKGKKAFVIGGGDTAVECAVELKRFGAESCLVHRRDSLRATDKNIACIKDECVNILWNTEIKKIEGDGKVEKILLANNDKNTEQVWDADMVLFSLGTMPNTEFIKKIGIELDNNSIKVDSDLRTNIEGIFAAGDIVGKWIRIPQAVGEGGLAGLNAFTYAKNPYWA